jgi:hypothetical protein
VVVEHCIQRVSRRHLRLSRSWVPLYLNRPNHDGFSALLLRGKDEGGHRTWWDFGHVGQLDRLASLDYTARGFVVRESLEMEDEYSRSFYRRPFVHGQGKGLGEGHAWGTCVPLPVLFLVLVVHEQMVRGKNFYCARPPSQVRSLCCLLIVEIRPSNTPQLYSLSTHREFQSRSL